MPKPTSTNEVLLKDLLTEYRASADWRLLSPSTRSSAEKVERMLAPLMGKPLADIARGDLLRIADNLSVGNTHIFLTRTRALLSFATYRGHLKANPLTGVKLPKTGEYRPWTQAEADTFMRGATPQTKMAIQLAYYTGQRMSDVLDMKWSDIQGGDIHVVQQKTRTPLRIPLHPNLKAALRTHRRQSPGETIVAMADGSAYATDSFRRRFERERAKLGLPKDLVFHGLRKLTAVSLAEKGASTREIMAVGGWKTSKQVDHYCKGASQRKLAGSAIEKLGALA